MSFSVSFSFSRLLQAPTHTGVPASGPSSTSSNAISVRLYPQWFKQISLDWTIPAEWGNCKFHVYSKPGASSEYERLTSMPISEPFFTDTTSQETSKFRKTEYIVEAFLPNGQSVKSLPSTWQYTNRSSITRMSSEIQRREYMLLSKYSGVKSFYFKRKYFGQRCHRCWNAAAEKVIDDHCPVCFGTSFEGGYYAPIPVYVQYDASPNNRILTYFGKSEINQTTCWTISVPEMMVDDILVSTGEWNVYRIAQSTVTQLQTNTVRQLFTLTQLGRGDIENELVKQTVFDDFGTYLDKLGGPFSKERFDRKDIDSSLANDHAWAQEQNLGDLPLKYHLDLPTDVSPPLTVAEGFTPSVGITRPSTFLEPIVTSDPIPKLKIRGTDLVDNNGNNVFLRGYNWGHWGTATQPDTADHVSQGANCVRLPLRWWGLYGDAHNPDSRNDYAFNTALIDPAHLQILDNNIAWASQAKLWIVLFIDSNCGQNGLQTGEPAYCDPSGLYPNGHNFWSDPDARKKFIDVWKFIANRYKNTPYLGIYEVLPEPDPQNVSQADISAFYAEVMDAIMEVDPNTPFLIGARQGYNLRRIKDSYIPGRNNVLYTGDLFIHPKSTQDLTLQNINSRLQFALDMRDQYNVPILIQQVGVETKNDPNGFYQSYVLNLLNQNKVPWTWWEYKGSSDPTSYSTYYTTNINNPNWIVKQPQYDIMTTYFKQPV